MTTHRGIFIIFVTATLVMFRGATAQESLTRSDTYEARIIKFDAPGAGTSAGQGTMPIGIVQGGWVMGNKGYAI